MFSRPRGFSRFAKFDFDRHSGLLEPCGKAVYVSLGKMRYGRGYPRDKRHVDGPAQNTYSAQLNARLVLLEPHSFGAFLEFCALFLCTPNFRTRLKFCTGTTQLFDSKSFVRS
jgi:hypothetical protein